MNSAAREAMWRHGDGGVEHVRVVAGDGGVAVDGVVVRRSDGGGVRRVRYLLQCDASWRVRELRVDAPEDGTTLSLASDGAGHWRDASGDRRDDLDGCIDVDLLAVAFTNTLPIRRLGMAVGESHLLAVAFVQLPSMEVVRAAQRYTRSGELSYVYENADSGFRAELLVDADGLVVEYPGLARRLPVY